MGGYRYLDVVRIGLRLNMITFVVAIARHPRRVSILTPPCQEIALRADARGRA
ncbi:MAG: hypothetical protein ACT6RT_24780 [Allorhizobium sp.]